MGIDVTVLRVFANAKNNFGNPLGVVDAGDVEPADRQALATQLGYSETIFVDPPAAGAHTAHARIFTPKTELPFAGHPTVGASWWLRQRGTPIHTLQVPAGVIPVSYTDERTGVRARADWAPEFAIHDLASPEDVLAADADDYPDDFRHYLWAWIDKSAGQVRARMFAPDLGVPEDEATGSAAARLTEFLSYDLNIIQGRGSVIHTSWSADGWVDVSGRVVSDGVTQVD